MSVQVSLFLQIFNRLPNLDIPREMRNTQYEQGKLARNKRFSQRSLWTKKTNQPQGTNWSLTQGISCILWKKQCQWKHG